MSRWQVLLGFSLFVFDRLWLTRHSACEKSNPKVEPHLVFTHINWAEPKSYVCEMLLHLFEMINLAHQLPQQRLQMFLSGIAAFSFPLTEEYWHLLVKSGLAAFSEPVCVWMCEPVLSSSPFLFFFCRHLFQFITALSFKERSSAHFREVTWVYFHMTVNHDSLKQSKKWRH